MRKISGGLGTCVWFLLYGDYMSLFGHYLRCSHEQLSSCGKTRYTGRTMKSAIWAIAGAIVGSAATSRGYRLEGQSWPAGTVVVLELSLVNEVRTLLRGNTSWRQAVAPVPV